MLSHRVSNGLEPDHDRQLVGPDLDRNCVGRLSADDKSHCLARLNLNQRDGSFEHP